MQNKVAVLITCFNRKDKTLNCLNSLFQQNAVCGMSLKVYLVDDASQDGTAEEVRNRYPEVIIIKGSGNLYWSGGMRLAFAEAMAKGYDYYLWLNDDVKLFNNALVNLFESYNLVIKDNNRLSIIVGALKDASTGALTYSGKRARSKLLPLSLVNVAPSGIPAACDTCNGNCVLIPDNVAKIIGNIDPVFIQSGGDIDYGFRAKAGGCSLWVASEYVGTCTRNPIKGTWMDKDLSLIKRFKLVPNLTKGKPLVETITIAKRYGGPFWFIYWLIMYRRILF